MEILLKTRVVKLRSHLDKFLVGDEDKEKIRQSKNGSSKRAIWVFEPSPKNPNAIRIKNFHTGLYLTASDNPFLLGMTGKRVVQLSIFDPTRIEWELINDGFLIKLKSNEGSYLRANGGTPPWRNSVTHDVPLVGGSYNWILWEVEPVSVLDIGSGLSDQLSPMSSFNSVLSSDEFSGSYPSSPLTMGSTKSMDNVFIRKSSMDLFCNAKAVRLRSHHDKYLTAEEDEESVTQDRNGSTRNSKWVVEFVESSPAIRLKSCYGKYLTASNQPFLLGMTGRKVTQTRPQRLDSSVEWEPVKDGALTRIRTRYGNFLRANGGLPPWRNSVTHDVPHRTSTQDWILWEVEIVEILDHNNDGENVDKVHGSGLSPGPVKVSHSDSFGSESSSVSTGSDKFQRQQSSDSGIHSPVKPDGRLIYYHVADEFGDTNEAVEGNSFTYKGHSVAELSMKLEQETGLDDIIICSRSPLNGKLYPLRLQLPPNNATMHIVVVPSTSKMSREFSKVRIV